MTIGLTGTYCAGKNYIAGFLEKKGLAVLDVDKLGYIVIETEKKVILDRFGTDILKPDNTIDRKLLGQKVFGKPAELAALEAIIHPAVNKMTDKWIAEQNFACVINAALLHRSSAFAKLDAVILVKAFFWTRFLRAVKRDKLPRKDIYKRLHSQKKFLSQYFLKKTDIYIVENPGPFIAAITGFFKTGAAKKPQDRVNEILSSLGIGS
ncbi:MAG: dephospho-CoA kinase [Treponema sp.]|nr:dephospho-CoA kinase [Treponema sp.]